MGRDSRDRGRGSRRIERARGRRRHRQPSSSRTPSSVGLLLHYFPSSVSSEVFFLIPPFLLTFARRVSLARPTDSPRTGVMKPERRARGRSLAPVFALGQWLIWAAHHKAQPPPPARRPIAGLMCTSPRTGTPAIS